jgi:hypothetical protein
VAAATAPAVAAEANDTDDGDACGYSAANGDPKRQLNVIGVAPHDCSGDAIDHD